jgi:hypothetical protein
MENFIRQKVFALGKMRGRRTIIKISVEETGVRLKLHSSLSQ